MPMKALENVNSKHANLQSTLSKTSENEICES
jgi:hypothetical protein